MVFTYDLLEDRRVDDVNITNIFPLFFKMVESSQNLDNISRDWAKDKVEKSLVEAVCQVRKAGRKKKESSNCLAWNLTNPISNVYEIIVFEKFILVSK